MKGEVENEWKAVVEIAMLSSEIWQNCGMWQGWILKVGLLI